jgi:hypothetical protein
MMNITASDSNTVIVAATMPTSIFSYNGTSIDISGNVSNGFLKMDATYCKQASLNQYFPGKKCKPISEAAAIITGV